MSTMRLIPKILLGFALALSIGVALSACGDDNAPLDLAWHPDHSVAQHATDAAQ